MKRSFFIFVFPWVYNSSIALKMLLHCPLICNESSANSEVILTFVPLYIYIYIYNVFLFLAPFKVFSLLLLLSSLNGMCHGVFFFLFWCLWVVELRGYWVFIQFSSVQSLSGVWLFVTPMDCSMPGFPVHHQFPELTHTHVHWVGDAIQPSHPLSSPSPPALNLSQHQGLFKWVSSLHQVAKVLEFQLQHQSFQWTYRTECSPYYR